MKPFWKLAVIIIAIIVAVLITDYIVSRTSAIHYDASEVEVIQPTLTHRQEIWIAVLEWCESRGYANAINEEDLDGTPSFGAFQFKPTTLDYYANLYGVSTTTLMDYETQRAVVTQMILHKDDINWYQQFPACVKRFGVPPRD